jgi:hypothetical protein
MDAKNNDVSRTLEKELERMINSLKSKRTKVNS